MNFQNQCQKHLLNTHHHKLLCGTGLVPLLTFHVTASW